MIWPTICDGQAQCYRHLLNERHAPTQIQVWNQAAALYVSGTVGKQCIVAWFL